jgi:hypothetical protein
MLAFMLLPWFVVFTDINSTLGFFCDQIRKLLQLAIQRISSITSLTAPYHHALESLPLRNRPVSSSLIPSSQISPVNIFLNAHSTISEYLVHVIYTLKTMTIRSLMQRRRKNSENSRRKVTRRKSKGWCPTTRSILMLAIRQVQF